MRQLAALFFLDAETIDLDRVALRGCCEAISTAVEEHDRSVEVIQERRRRIRPEVWEEQVDAFVVDARDEQPAVAVPLLTDIVAQCGCIERLHRRDGSLHRARAEVELA